MDEKLRRQMQTLDRLYKESDRIGDDYAAHFGMNIPRSGCCIRSAARTNP